jgi:hypothetical protein
VKRSLSITEPLDRVGQFSREELVECWINHYGQPPPKAASRSLLERAVAYAIQVEHTGGLEPRMLKALLRHAEAAGLGKRPSRSDSGINRGNHTAKAEAAPPRSAAKTHLVPALRPGMRIVREWQGKGHVVDVLDHGFKWNGKTYRSLSAVASGITGAKWSGPRFFRV